jgi:DNA-binding CsgD family transcriptional regulator
MGAVDHLKTLCCLGLPPESAMIAVAPLLHEIIPHGWTRDGLFEPNGAIEASYGENPAADALYRERVPIFMKDPSSLVSFFFGQVLRKGGSGWALDRQGGGYLESPHFREIEAPLDACWFLDSLVSDGGRVIGWVHLTRPRSARPFTKDDVQVLNRLRPWLAHAFRRPNSGPGRNDDVTSSSAAGTSLLSGQVILTANEKPIFQTTSIEPLFKILAGETGNYTRDMPIRAKMPPPVLQLVRQIVGAANGTSDTPPRMRVATPYGVLALEAQWLAPAGAHSGDVARDPQSCLISVTIELREHFVAHAARVLRQNGATPAQVKVGIQLGLGKTKQVIADEFGIQISSVADLSKKLYQRLDIHNAAELGLKLWLDQI